MCIGYYAILFSFYVEDLSNRRFFSILGVMVDRYQSIPPGFRAFVGVAHLYAYHEIFLENSDV